MMLAKFRHRYPQGSLVSELVEIDRGTYIVKALVQIDNIVLATALAGGASVEAAEDAAKERAIATLFLDSQPQGNAVPAAAQSNPTNHQIVNFSKPQPESVASSPTIASPKQIVEALPTVSSSPSATKLDADSQLEATPNLFGDTFTATAPVTITEPENSANTLAAEATADSAELEAMDFNDIKQKTDIEIKRLGWTGEQGRDFLMSRYGKRSRLHLKDEQLIEFLHYLENLPNPTK
ncbi:MAG: hypothetical protein AAF652_00105 [Cyanobacteria bacterium P01_C01_bin.72]